MNENIAQICNKMHAKGYDYVCIDARDLTPFTNVTEKLGLSETPDGAFIFVQISEIKPTCSVSEKLIFASPISTCLLSHDDERLHQFAYRNDDADLDIDPKLKYFWRGVASKLNASGITVTSSPPAECTLPPNSITVWKGNALTNIVTIDPFSQEEDPSGPPSTNE
jgi:hypothetical protein